MIAATGPRTRQRMGANRELIVATPQGGKITDLSWDRMNSIRSSARYIAVKFSSFQQGNKLYTLVRVR